MDIQRISAFSIDGQGGNPAGVVLTDQMPAPNDMQRVAAEVGFSETAFAVPQDGGYRVRYFAPEGEVAFCGHATIALGTALGRAVGAGTYELSLNDAQISVSAEENGGGWQATLQSPTTSYKPVPPDLREGALALFNWTSQELDADLPMALINGGAQHLLVPLARQDLLQKMSYDFDKGASLMQAHKLVTINLIWRESPNLIHSRNAFAGHGVYEDPATGAAAAALAGYLRDSGRGAHSFEVRQGEDMGAASRLWVNPLPGKGQPVRVGGAAHVMAEPAKAP